MPIAAMTYSSLLEDMRRYLDRGGGLDPLVEEQLPRFVMLAENRLAREAKMLATKLPVTGEMVPFEPIISKPERWRETISFNIAVSADPVGAPFVFNKYQSLYYRSYETVRTFWPNPGQTGIPLYYADYDYNHWLIAPTPALEHPFEILFYQRIDPLSEEAQSNLYTQNYPDLLLYACLLESAPFLKDDQRLQTWQAIYQQALASTTGEQQTRQVDNAQQNEV